MFCLDTELLQMLKQAVLFRNIAVSLNLFEKSSETKYWDIAVHEITPWAIQKKEPTLTVAVDRYLKELLLLEKNDSDIIVFFDHGKTTFSHVERISFATNCSAGIPGRVTVIQQQLTPLSECRPVGILMPIFSSRFFSELILGFSVHRGASLKAPTMSLDVY
ncbi:hypothetical protein T07_13121 [Trichinella nelsoni]|uniref:Uncharacterized protein n=1 Tax=Trichinella nelsoni TaxID=6336 RepID=A0A0V0S8D6_9BILA|nr:hypothetical protein T07_13121 [Trichinella nelsoni]